MNYARIPNTWEIVAGEWQGPLFITKDGRVFENPANVWECDLPENIRNILTGVGCITADELEPFTNEQTGVVTGRVDCVYFGHGNGSHSCELGGQCTGPCKFQKEFPF